MTAPNLLTNCECEGAMGQSIDWTAALSTHERWLRTVVLAQLGERQAVDEVMQEVSLAAVAQRSPLTDPSKVAAWLYRIAVRSALLYRRQRGRQHRLEGRYAQSRCERPGESGAADPLGWLLQEERRQLLLAALARMPRRDAEILLLKYTENWSYRELAEHLGLSLSAVEARLHRVRRRLREDLASARISEVLE